MRADGSLFHLVMIDREWPPDQLQKLNRFLSDWLRTRDDFEPKPGDGEIINYCKDPVRADQLILYIHGLMKERRDFVALRSDAFTRSGSWSFEIELPTSSGHAFAKTWQLAVSLAVAEYATTLMGIKMWVEHLMTEDPKHAQRVAEFLADAGGWRGDKASAHQKVDPGGPEVPSNRDISNRLSTQPGHESGTEKVRGQELGQNPSSGGEAEEGEG